MGWALAAMGIAAQARAEDIFLASPMVTDTNDKQLINPWGISASGTSPFWISDNGAGVSTLYSVDPNSNVATKLLVGCDHPRRRECDRASLQRRLGVPRRSILVRQRRRIHFGLATLAWHHRREARVALSQTIFTRARPWISQVGTATCFRQTSSLATLMCSRENRARPI